MIRDTARAFLADASDSAAVRAAMAGQGDAWARVTGEMGWQALTIPESCEGLGLGWVELAIVHEAAGETLLVSPLFATLGTGVSLLRACAGEQQQADWLPGIAAGEATLGVGMQGPGKDWGLRGCGVRYRPGDAGYELRGELASVVDGAIADTLLVVALDETESPESARVFRVAADAQGVTRRQTPGLDQTRDLAHLQLSEVQVAEDDLLDGSRAGWPAIQAGLDLGVIALAAELLGTAQRSLDLAVTYTLEREQFGRPVAGFQALKHKAADMMLRCECARSAVYYAACTADAFLEGQASAAQLAEAASIAKASAGDAAFENAGEALQMHGGVGFTWEYDIHLYFKRARAGRAQWGSSDWHRERIAEFILDGDEAMS